ncbi:MAG: HmuY family protein [Cyclobacteriaceae bacterium]|nr:HmuY family protein [Cyclobacteriaceae bacterium]
MKYASVVLTVVAFSVMLASCSKSDPTPASLSAVTFKNLAADPPSGGYDPNNGQPIGVTQKFTFFSFKTGAVVSNADSASSKWDIGFRGTTIIVNSGTSGPGTAAALVVTGVFDELNAAPDNGYLQDDKASATAPYAIPKGSGKGWYNYDPATNVISPVAGRVIMVQTADGKYAKVEILSYYKDAPAAPTNTSVDRYYTFRYVYQPDGSKKLQ